MKLEHFRKFMAIFFMLLSVVSRADSWNFERKELVGYWVGAPELDDGGDEYLSALEIKDDGEVVSTMLRPYKEMILGVIDNDSKLNLSQEAIDYLQDQIRSEGLEITINSVIMKFGLISDDQLGMSISSKDIIDPQYVLNNPEPGVYLRTNKSEFNNYIQKMKDLDAQNRYLVRELSKTSWELIDIISEDSNGKKTITNASEIESFEVFYRGEESGNPHKRYNLKEINFLDENELLINNELKSKYEINGTSFFTFREDINMGIENVGKMKIDNDLLFISDYSTIEDSRQIIKINHIYKFKKVLR